MSRLGGVWVWFRRSTHRRAAEREMDDELRFHLEMEAEKNIREGMEPAEARRRALLTFGGMEGHREELRGGRSLGWVEDVARDVRYAVRALGRSPGFALIAVLTIAIGVGGTTAVFSVANALLFRPLPVADPASLVTVDEQRVGAVSTDMGYHAVPYERYLAYEEATREVFSGLAAWRTSGFSLRARGETAGASGAHTSANYFSVLGVRPALGRFFSGDDAAEIVLSDLLWRERFAGDTGVVGEVAYVDSRPYTVVGVAPPGFGGTVVGISLDLWVPSRARGMTGMTNWVIPIGRLRPGVEPTQAAVAVDGIARRIPPDEPQTTVRGARLDPMTGVPGGGRTALLGFFGMLLVTAVLVLLIASVNVAGMLLSRAVSRRRELAVRLAIGSGRRRLVQQLLTETAILFLIGGLAGLGIAFGATRLLERVQLRPLSLRVVLEVSPDLRVLAFGLLVSLAAGLLCGLAPALRGARGDLTGALKDGAAAGATGIGRGRSLFVAAQLAISVLLLVMAGLFVRSLQQGMRVDPGFDPDGVVVASLDLGPHGYDRERRDAFYSRLIDRARAIPGVEDAALAQIVLLSGLQIGGDLSTGEDDGTGGVRIPARHNRVDPEYFSVLRIPMVAGRTFSAEDRDGAPRVVILNEIAAERLWPGSTPLGNRVRMDGTEYEVVGVARDGKYAFIGEDPLPFAFFPRAQSYAPGLTLHVRTRGGAEPTLRRIREEVRALDPNVAIEDARPLMAVIGLSLLPHRLTALLVGLFGTIGLLLAGTGVYGVLAFHVAQRTREIGIRIALGARAGDVLRLVVGRGAVLAAAGGLAGLLLAAGTSRLLRTFLFGVSPLDAVTFATVPVLLLTVAVAASYIPARRAMRVDPMEALRQD